MKSTLTTLIVVILFSIKSQACDPRWEHSNACAGDTIFFYGINQGGAFTWYFGDTASGAANISHDPVNTYHIYNSPGVYYATLTVNWGGAWMSKTRKITIGTDCANAAIEYDHCGGQYTFYNASTGNYLSAHWDFGDFATTNNTQLVNYHNYHSPGTYIVSLYIDYGSSQDTAYDTLVVDTTCYGFPSVYNDWFEYHCVNDTVDFPVSAQGDSCYFDYGDPSSGPLNYFTGYFDGHHQYDSAGYYVVTIVIYNAGIITDTIYSYVLIEDCNVWPGNVNKDGVVDVEDAFGIGIYYGSTGIARSSSSINWSPQSCSEWTTGVFNGIQSLQKPVNMKHADCNGDGVVNDLDLAVIQSNYSRQMPNYLFNDKVQNTPGSSDPVLFVNTTYPWTGSYNISVPIDLINLNFVSAYGICGRIFYDSAHIVPGSMSITVNGWLGQEGVDAISLIEPYHTGGFIDFAIVRTDQNNRGGIGTIAYLNFTLSQPGYSLGFRFDNLKRITFEDSGEHFLPISSLDTWLNIMTASVPEAKSESLQLFPNPVTDRLYIRKTNSLIGNKLTVTDAIGNVFYIDETEGDEFFILNTTSLSSGMYFLTLENEGSLQISKFIKE